MYNRMGFHSMMGLSRAFREEAKGVYLKRAAVITTVVAAIVCFWSFPTSAKNSHPEHTHIPAHPNHLLARHLLRLKGAEENAKSMSRPVGHVNNQRPVSMVQNVDTILRMGRQSLRIVRSYQSNVQAMWRPLDGLARLHLKEPKSEASDALLANKFPECYKTLMRFQMNGQLSPTEAANMKRNLTPKIMGAFESQPAQVRELQIMIGEVKKNEKLANQEDEEAEPAEEKKGKLHTLKMKVGSPFIRFKNWMKPKIDMIKDKVSRAIVRVSDFVSTHLLIMTLIGIPIIGMNLFVMFILLEWFFRFSKNVLQKVIASDNMGTTLGRVMVVSAEDLITIHNLRPSKKQEEEPKKEMNSFIKHAFAHMAEVPKFVNRMANKLEAFLFKIIVGLCKPIMAIASKVLWTGVAAEHLSQFQKHKGLSLLHIMISYVEPVVQLFGAVNQMDLLTNPLTCLQILVTLFYQVKSVFQTGKVKRFVNKWLRRIGGATEEAMTKLEATTVLLNQPELVLHINASIMEEHDARLKLQADAAKWMANANQRKEFEGKRMAFKKIRIWIRRRSDKKKEKELTKLMKENSHKAAMIYYLIQDSSATMRLMLVVLWYDILESTDHLALDQNVMIYFKRAFAACNLNDQENGKPDEPQPGEGAEMGEGEGEGEGGAEVAGKEAGSGGSGTQEDVRADGLEMGMAQQ